MKSKLSPESLTWCLELTINMIIIISLLFVKVLFLQKTHLYNQTKSAKIQQDLLERGRFHTGICPSHRLYPSVLAFFCSLLLFFILLWNTKEKHSMTPDSSRKPGSCLSNVIWWKMSVTAAVLNQSDSEKTAVASKHGWVRMAVIDSSYSIYQRGVGRAQVWG